MTRVEWADIIFVMERAHRARLQRRFRAHLKRARVICLDIPDDYAFMQPELVALLEKTVAPHLKCCRHPGEGRDPAAPRRRRNTAVSGIGAPDSFALSRAAGSRPSPG